MNCPLFVSHGQKLKKTIPTTPPVPCSTPGPRKDELKQPNTDSRMEGLTINHFFQKKKKNSPQSEHRLALLQQINTVCNSLPFCFDVKEAKEFHCNGTRGQITRLGSKAIKKRKEKTVSLCPWKKGQSTFVLLHEEHSNNTTQRYSETRGHAP